MIQAREVAVGRNAVQRHHNALGIPGCIGWWDAYQLVGFETGDLVTTWPDMSGSGYDATSGGGSRAAYRETHAPSGLPALYFGPTIQQYDVTDIGAVGFSGISEGTLFVVFGLNSDNQWGIFDTMSASGPFWSWGGDGNGYFGVFRAGRIAGQPPNQPTTGWHQHTVRSGPANGYDIRRNGSLDLDTTTDWSFPANARIGYENVANQLDGWISEIRLYARELTDAEVTETEQGLVSKWGV